MIKKWVFIFLSLIRDQMRVCKYFDGIFPLPIDLSNSSSSQFCNSLKRRRLKSSKLQAHSSEQNSVRERQVLGLPKGMKELREGSKLSTILQNRRFYRVCNTYMTLISCLSYSTQQLQQEGEGRLRYRVVKGNPKNLIKHLCTIILSVREPSRWRQTALLKEKVENWRNK